MSIEGQFAIVELMGRQCFGAKVQEVEQLGIKMLRCQVLTEPPYERDVHPQSLYAITRCSEQRAKLACQYLVSPNAMPVERPLTQLTAPAENPFDDPESDDIPFGRSSADDRPPDDEDPEGDDLEEFVCGQCGICQVIKADDAPMCLPEEWEAAPPAWSVVVFESGAVEHFCDEECVRRYLNDPPEDVKKARKEQGVHDG